MKNMRDLTQAEFEIMDILWEKGEATARQVQAALYPRRSLAYSTIATTLYRIRDKGYVEAQERNFAYVFRPIVKREQVVDRKLNDLVDRVLGGSLGPIATYIAEKRKLTPAQIDTLEDLLESEAGDDV